MASKTQNPNEKMNDAISELDAANNPAPVGEVGGKPVVTHDEFLAAVPGAVASGLKYAQINEGSLGLTVVEKYVKEGNFKLDENKQATTERWPDKYVIHYAFNGGSNQSYELPKPLYDTLQVGVMYVGKYRLGNQPERFNKNSHPIVFSEIIPFEQFMREQY